MLFCQFDQDCDFSVIEARGVGLRMTNVLTS